MKTLVFQSPDNNKRVEVKVDIFAKNTQLLTPGFDTRFTNMEIVRSEGAVEVGMDLTEIEKDWQQMIAFAKTRGFSLSVMDINENDQSKVVEVTKVADGTVSGTLAANIVTGVSTTFEEDVEVGDKLVIDGFVYEVAVVTSDTSITLKESIAKTFATKPFYIIK